MNSRRFKIKNPLFWWAAGLALISDRLTKAWIVATYALTIPPQTTPIIPGVFHITYVTNTGAAFSSLPMAVSGCVGCLLLLA